MTNDLRYTGRSELVALLNNDTLFKSNEGLKRFLVYTAVIIKATDCFA